MKEYSIGDEKTMYPGGGSGGYSLCEGIVFGEYKIIRALGRGGMGEVYEAENVVTHKKFALKVLPRAATGGTFVDRFRIEARVMMDLRHPHIVLVHHAGEEGGLYYLTMDLVVGKEGEPESLEDLLKARGGRLKESEVRRIALEICGALESAHKKGVVHRDLKPGNVLLDEEGHAHVSDFGLAKVVGSEYLNSVIERSISLSIAGGRSLGDEETVGEDGGKKKASSSARALLGTYDYMAPEQKSGGEISLRTDIYSFGVMLYRMLTGKKPEGRFKLPSAFSCAKTWDNIVAKCLETSPSDRYSSVSELRADIERVGRVLVRPVIYTIIAVAIAICGGWWLLRGNVSGIRLAEKKLPEIARQPDKGSEKAVDTPVVEGGEEVLFEVEPAEVKVSVFGGKDLVYSGQTDKGGKLEVKLARGRYEIELQKDGYQLLSTEIEITGASTQRFMMTPLRGVVLIKTVRGAKVRAEGLEGKIELGKADDNGELRYDRLVEGKYTVKIEHPDYYEWVEEVEVRKDRIVEVKGELKGKPGSVYISASPEAEVWVDGEKKGKTGERIGGLEPGVRHFEVRRSGYRTERFEIEVLPNRDASRKVLGDLVRESGGVRIEAEVPEYAKGYFGKVEKRVKIGSGVWKKVTLPHVEEGLSCEETVVELQAAGFRVEKRVPSRIFIEDGKTSEVRFTVVPEEAKLTITANAPGAEIYDKRGKKAGVAGKEIAVDSLKDMELIIKADGYANKEVRLLSMEPGKAYKHEAVLEKIKGPVAGQDWRSPSTGMEFVWVEALKMWVGKYEVTNGEYRKKNPKHDSGDHEGRSLNGDRQPVVYVNFDDAKEYAEWLTERDREAGVLPEGYRYRLPSEEEFMVYCQCGDGRKYPWGKEWPPRSGQAGNYAGQQETSVLGWLRGGIKGYDDGHIVTCDVEESWANPWGLYGVGGNVWEACASGSSGKSFGAWCGASWYSYYPDDLLCAARLDYGDSDRDFCCGFRVVLLC